ncbi:MAG: carbohydrate kinase [Planctomycetaceae bacterium]|nr:carbohydrate kinase [Planctomycetaceae bacterium]
MSGFRIVAVGELLWDLLPDGRQLGGAPGNVAQHARSLGADVVLISRVGRDELGEAALARLEAAGLSTAGIQRDAEAPTGTAAVRVDRDGQPHFDLAADVAWDHLAAVDPGPADAVYFGTLAQRAPTSRRTIRGLLDAGRLRVLDLNLRDPYWSEECIRTSLGLADVVKLSEHELDRCAALLGLSGRLRDRMEQLARRHSIDYLAVTRGERGSLIRSRGEWAEHPGLAVPIRDAVGAGDAFTAALLMGLLRGDPLDRISRHANDVAAYVCTQPGATPRLPESLRDKVLEGR